MGGYRVYGELGWVGLVEGSVRGVGDRVLWCVGFSGEHPGVQKTPQVGGETISLVCSTIVESRWKKREQEGWKSGYPC